MPPAAVSEPVSGSLNQFFQCRLPDRREDMRSNSTFDGSSAEALRQGFFRYLSSVFQALGIASLDLIPQGRSLAVGNCHIAG
jgi:hypothetical protein